MHLRRVGDDGRVPADEVQEVVKAAVEMAVLSPSLYNTQPWWFGFRDARISVHADVDRVLNVADPDGREMVISCGAALFTLRIALRGLGFEPRVRLLPDPDRPSLLADVSFGAAAHITEDVQRLYAQIHRRRTHRGAFRPGRVPAALLTWLREEARGEGAMLQIAVDSRTQGALAALTEAADHIQRLDPSHVAELARWAPVPGSERMDGVPDTAYPRRAERTKPHFPGRDFARGHSWGAEAVPADASAEEVVGTVAIITTAGDTRADWLRAGQALQKVLLRGCAEEDLVVAFHTQALEVPELREFIRIRLCAGHYPQVLFRLGRPAGGEGLGGAARRSVQDVIVPEG